MSAEHRLWTLHQNDQSLDARVRVTTAGLEVRLYIEDACIWSAVVRPDQDLRAFVAGRRRAFEELGWSAR